MKVWEVVRDIGELQLRNAVLIVLEDSGGSDGDVDGEDWELGLIKDESG